MNENRLFKSEAEAVGRVFVKLKLACLIYEALLSPAVSSSRADETDMGQLESLVRYCLIVGEP